MHQQPMWLSAHSLINAHKIKFNFGCLIALGGQNCLLGKIIDRKTRFNFLRKFITYAVNWVACCAKAVIASH